MTRARTAVLSAVALVLAGISGAPAHAAQLAPGPVGGLTAVGGMETVSLSWVNPTDADFDHVVVVERTQGRADPPVVPARREVYTGTGHSTVVEVSPYVNWHAFDVTPYAKDGTAGLTVGALVNASVIDVEHLERTVDYPNPLHVQGVLENYLQQFGGPGRRIELVPVSFDSGLGKAVAEGKTDENSAVALQTVPDHTGLWALMFRGGPGWMGTLTTLETVVVRPHLTLKVPRTEIRPGETATIHVDCNPVDAGSAIALQRLDGADWVTVGKYKLGSRGLDVRIRSVQPGSGTYRIHKPATERLGAVDSDQVTITAVKAR
jgi:hypothetical protein